MHTQQTNRRRRDTHEKQQTQEDQRNHSGKEKEQRPKQLGQKMMGGRRES